MKIWGHVHSSVAFYSQNYISVIDSHLIYDGTGGMFMTKKNVREIVDHLNSINEPVSRVVAVHLYCERIINKLIETKSVRSKKVSEWKNQKDFQPLKSANFVTKIYFAYNMGWITEGLYNNLYLLNAWRNKFSHNLDIEAEELNYDFDLLGNLGVRIVGNRNLNEDLRAITIVTFGALHAFIMSEHKIDY